MIDDNERVARAFHESYERLAPGHGYETRIESAVPWEDVPAPNRALMISVVADLRGRGIIELKNGEPGYPGPLETKEDG